MNQDTHANPDAGPADVAPTDKAPPIRTQLPIPIDREARHNMIAQAAYFRAERRGFAAGFEWDDWLAAEREIACMLDE